MGKEERKLHALGQSNDSSGIKYHEVNRSDSPVGPVLSNHSFHIGQLHVTLPDQVRPATETVSHGLNSCQILASQAKLNKHCVLKKTEPPQL